MTHKIVICYWQLGVELIGSAGMTGKSFSIRIDARNIRVRPTSITWKPERLPARCALWAVAPTMQPLKASLVCSDENESIEESIESKRRQDRLSLTISSDSTTPKDVGGLGP